MWLTELNHKAEMEALYEVDVPLHKRGLEETK